MIQNLPVLFDKGIQYAVCKHGVICLLTKTTQNKHKCFEQVPKLLHHGDGKYIADIISRNSLL